MLSERDKYLIEQVWEAAFLYQRQCKPMPLLAQWLSENEQRLASEAPDNWIPVNERLPELYETILACNKEEIKVCRYTTFHPDSVGYKRGERGKWFEYIDHDSVFSFNNVTHWQPLEPPTGEDE